MSHIDAEREQTNVRLSVEIKRRLERDAKRNRRSMSLHVEAILDEQLPPLEDQATPVAS